jgi:hypothetical protein
MKYFDITSSIALVLVGLVSGFCLTFLFKGCYNETTVPHQKVISTEDLKKQAADKEAIYQTKIAELENKNLQLQTELKTTKEQLVSIKSKTKQRENTIKKIIEPKGLPAKELLDRVKPLLSIDSSLSPCDSLVQEVNVYMEENAVKDSLYESEISTLDSMVAVKDSVIKFKTELHSQWVEVFTKALDQQDILQKENDQLRKQFKRQKRKSKLVTIGLMILSAAGANYLLHH